MDRTTMRSLPFNPCVLHVVAHRSACQIGRIADEAPHVTVQLQAAELVEPLRRQDRINACGASFAVIWPHRLDSGQQTILATCTAWTSL